jgi:hypothetical protein
MRFVMEVGFQPSRGIGLRLSEMNERGYSALVLKDCYRSGRDGSASNLSLE